MNNFNNRIEVWDIVLPYSSTIAVLMPLITQLLLKTTSISTLFFQNPCTIQINALPLQQHTYPASRKNSALRVSLFFYEHDITILQPAAHYG